MKHPAHEQIPLFGARTGARRGSKGSNPWPIDQAPLARNSDPLSSHLAAAEVTASGRRESQKREIIAALRSYPAPVTSMELAYGSSIDRYVVARRLPDLERDGLVERREIRDCRVSGRPAITWTATGATV